jgi:hypothetical protein
MEENRGNKEEEKIRFTLWVKPSTMEEVDESLFDGILE